MSNLTVSSTIDGFMQATDNTDVTAFLASATAAAPSTVAATGITLPGSYQSISATTGSLVLSVASTSDIIDFFGGASRYVRFGASGIAIDSGDLFVQSGKVGLNDSSTPSAP